MVHPRGNAILVSESGVMGKAQSSSGQEMNSSFVCVRACVRVCVCARSASS